MTEDVRKLIRRLDGGDRLTEAEFLRLLEAADEESDALLREKAVAKRKAVYGNAVFVRGLIEISSYCKNDCLYCGIRRSNQNADRYRLSKEQILACAEEGYSLGFRTFVLQGGEDGFFTDEKLVPLLRELKRRHPDCAVTLSLGERGRESFQRLFNAGADRYLLRHETATKSHYKTLHPPEMSFDRRMECLRDLRAIGYRRRGPLPYPAPAGAQLVEPHGMFAAIAGDRLRGGRGLHGGQPRSDGGTPCRRPVLHTGVSAGDVRHRALHPP